MIDAFWSRVDPTGFCWEWVGSVSRSGYGQFWSVSKDAYEPAHRVGYELLIGAVPEGLCLDHLCRNRKCVNPDHLEPVSLGENVLRGFGPGALNARKVSCKRGHSLSGENVYHRSGKRYCRECRAEAQRRYTERKTGLKPVPRLTQSS